MKNLTTKEGRTDAINTIEKSFLTALRVSECDIADDAVCIVERTCIKLGIAAIGDYKKKGYKVEFASEISLYAAEQNSTFRRRENEINFGSSGCFTPEVRASYWRTVHAASILKKWTTVTEIINDHCAMYADLEKNLQHQSN